MRRREFLLSAAAATAAMAQTPAEAPAGRKLKVDIYSGDLQWLRRAEEVAQAAIEMAFDGVDVTVGPYPAHIDADRVAQELPPFVNAIRKHGVEVATITCMGMVAEGPNAENILQAASSLGITHYSREGFHYEPNKPVMEQLEALKPRVAKLAAVNAKYKMKAALRTGSGANSVGAAVWDLLYLLRNFDPAQVGIHYDLGKMTSAGGDGVWALNLRAAGAYIAGVSATDFVFERNLEVNGGGP